MGYELEKLKNLYGLSSPVSNYTGSSMPSAPAALGSNPTPAEQQKYNASIETYNKAMPNYLADQDAYQKYMQDRRQRLFNTSMYAPAQPRLTLSAPMYSNYSPNAQAPVTQNSIAAPSLAGRMGFSHGGSVQKFGVGGIYDDDTSDGTTDDTVTSGSVDPASYNSLLQPDVDHAAVNKAYGTYRQQQQDIADLMSKYMEAQKARKPDKSEMYWKLAAAFGSPTKTGAFGESLANAAGVMGDYKKDEAATQRADEANMLQLGLKQKEALANMSQEDYQALLSQQAKVDANNRTVRLAQIKAGASSGSTVYEKQAISEGFTKNTHEFVTRIKQLWSEAHRQSNPADPAPTLATIIDPTDPSKAIVVNARTYKGGGATAAGVIGTANKDSITANLSSKDIQELNASYPALNASSNAAIAEIDSQLAALDKLEKHAGLDYITGPVAGRVDVGSLTGAGAAALQLYNTVTSRALTQALAAARANSPSGASGFGNLTESEGKILRDSQATLGRAQPTDEFKENLKTYRAKLQASKNALVNKFNETYAFRGVQPTNGGTGAGANVVPPPRPANVPATAGYSPSQHKWFWKDASGKPVSAPAQ